MTGASAVGERAASPKVLYVQYTNPAAYPPLEHGSRILAGAGWRVRFLGVGVRGVSALRFPPHPSIETRQLPACAPGWRQKLHYLRYLVWVAWHALAWRPRWVYASELLSAPVALVLSYLPGMEVVYHEHDSPQPNAGSTRFARFCLACRRRLGRRASLCVLPNADRARRFAESIPGVREVRVVWNCPRVEEVGPAREPADERLRLFYHGSLNPHALPTTLIDALALLPEQVTLMAVGYETIGCEGYSAVLRAHAAERGVGHRVEVRGPIARSEGLLDLCRRADVGIATMPRATEDVNMATMVGASNKAFDYLSSGLALLVSDLPDWRAAFVDPGYALACDPQVPESIAAALRRYAESPGRAREMGEEGRRRVLAEWNYEAQFAAVRERMSGRARSEAAERERELAVTG